MDEKVQILLNSTKNIASVDKDNYQKLELENKSGEIIEYDIRNALSATEIFDAEREANPNYRIYGRIEYLSLLNGLSNTYNTEGAFFIKTGNTNVKNIFSSFKFYLLKAGTGYTQVISGSTIFWVRYFEVIATPSDFELYNAGYTNNVYGEQVYAFNFNKDFDITPYVDAFGFPATELFLFPQYQVGKNGDNPQITEVMSGTSWGTNGVRHKMLFTLPMPILNLGDRVYGDLIEYSQSLFLQIQTSPQIYYISTPYKDGSTQKYLQWKYNPFIPFTLRYFSDSLYEANTGTTSYAEEISIPYYATPVGSGNYVWRDIVPQGFIDPLNNQGVNYPFINMKRYLFSPVILDITPDLNDSNTFSVFSEIKFGEPTILNKSPLGDINNIGKPCQ